MADTLRDQIDDLCRLADRVIKNPSVTPEDVVIDTSFGASPGFIGMITSVHYCIKNGGVTASIDDSSWGDFDSTTGAIGGGTIGAGVGLALGGPLGLAIGTALGSGVGYLLGKNNEKEAELKRAREKTAMLQKVIAKQQAVINRLKDLNKLNRQEIENLKKMNAILQAAIEKLQKL